MPPFAAGRKQHRPKYDGNPTNVTQLREFLVLHFSLDELAELCTDLDVNIENLGGQGLSGKARELIAYLQRRERLPELAVALKWEPPQESPSSPFDQRGQRVTGSQINVGNVTGPNIVIGNGNIVGRDLNIYDGVSTGRIRGNFTNQPVRNSQPMESSDGQSNTLQVTGIRNDDINARGQDVVVKGTVNGDITNAGVVTNCGTINGDITCRQYVDRGGTMNGDIEETG